MVLKCLLAGYCQVAVILSRCLSSILKLKVMASYSEPCLQLCITDHAVTVSVLILIGQCMEIIINRSLTKICWLNFTVVGLRILVATEGLNWKWS